MEAEVVYIYFLWLTRLVTTFFIFIFSFNDGLMFGSFIFHPAGGKKRC